MKKIIITFNILLAVLFLFSCGNNANIQEDVEIDDEAVQQIERQLDSNGNYVRVGEFVPEFNINYLNGEEAKISSLKGKVVLINFWASWCPYCVEEFKVIKKGIVDRYADREDFVAILINRGEEPSVIEEWMKKKNYSLTDRAKFPAVALDRDSTIFHLFAEIGIPRNYVIDKEGKLSYLGLDYTEEEFRKLQKAIDETLIK